MRFWRGKKAKCVRWLWASVPLGSKNIPHISSNVRDGFDRCIAASKSQLQWRQMFLHSGVKTAINDSADAKYLCLILPASYSLMPFTVNLYTAVSGFFVSPLPMYSWSWVGFSAPLTSSWGGSGASESASGGGEPKQYIAIKNNLARTF